MRAARRKPWFGTTQLALLLAAGCSLQNFDYLQQSSGGSSSGGTSGAAGTSAGGTETNGGEPSSAGTGNTTAGGTTSGNGSGAAAGADETGGSGGTPSGGKGGSGGSGGKGGNGGSGGSGATGQLVNGSFETNTTIGWTIKPTTTYAFTQTPKGTATTPDGSYQFATWSDDKPFAIDLFQTITGLEDGVYVFKGYFNLGPGVASFNGVEAYASKCGGPDPDPVGVQPAGDSTWLPVSVEGIEVTGGSCTVGVRIDWNAKAWLNADLFTFERVSDIGAGGAGGQGGAN